jgi:type I restriction enzyme M protein
LLPENLFYNTTAPGIILVLNRQKTRQGVLLINASHYFVQEKPKNVLTKEGINTVATVYQQWETREKLSRVVSLEEIREADYNLSPSQFVQVAEAVSHRSLSGILADLQEVRKAREKADCELAQVLERLGLNGESLT